MVLVLCCLKHGCGSVKKLDPDPTCEKLYIMIYLLNYHDFCQYKLKEKIDSSMLQEEF